MGTDGCHGIRSGYVADPDTVDCTGHVHDIIVDENIEVSANQGSPIARLSASIADGCGGAYGPSGTKNHYCATFCKNGEITCGKTLVISNVKSTYDSTVQSRKSGLNSSTPSPTLSRKEKLVLQSSQQLVSSLPSRTCSSLLPRLTASFLLALERSALDTPVPRTCHPLEPLRKQADGPTVVSPM